AEIHSLRMNYLKSGGESVQFLKQIKQLEENIALLREPDVDTNSKESVNTARELPTQIPMTAIPFEVADHVAHPDYDPQRGFCISLDRASGIPYFGPKDHMAELMYGTFLGSEPISQVEATQLRPYRPEGPLFIGSLNFATEVVFTDVCYGHSTATVFVRIYDPALSEIQKAVKIDDRLCRLHYRPFVASEAGGAEAKYPVGARPWRDVMLKSIAVRTARPERPKLEVSSSDVDEADEDELAGQPPSLPAEPPLNCFRNLSIPTGFAELNTSIELDSRTLFPAYKGSANYILSDSDGTLTAVFKIYTVDKETIRESIRDIADLPTFSDQDLQTWIVRRLAKDRPNIPPMDLSCISPYNELWGFKVSVDFAEGLRNKVCKAGQAREVAEGIHQAFPIVIISLIPPASLYVGSAGRDGSIRITSMLGLDSKLKSPEWDDGFHVGKHHPRQISPCTSVVPGDQSSSEPHCTDGDTDPELL
ncbi:hypothetical protein HK405_003932, partial [Cladochytrium tenue]